jgi:hypothetical protein
VNAEGPPSSGHGDADPSPPSSWAPPTTSPLPGPPTAPLPRVAVAEPLRRSRRNRRNVIAGVGVVVLAAAVVGAVLWSRAGDDGATPTTAASTGTTAAATTAAVTTTASSAAAPTTTSASASAPPTSSASVLAGAESAGSEAALATARDVAGALADGDWSVIHRLSPTDTRTDAEFEAAYGAVRDVTIVPARVVRSSVGADLRLGLVAHEEHESGPATAVMCVHWRVNQAAGTVDRVSSARLRLEPGWTDPASLADELRRVCATYPLR